MVTATTIVPTIVAAIVCTTVLTIVAAIVHTIFIGRVGEILNANTFFSNTFDFAFA